MGTVTQFRRAKFAVGDLVHHSLFNYRGVVFDVDPTFQGSEEWYEAMARTRPPKNRPWYHVLNHPMLGRLFSDFEDGRYVVPDRRSN